VSVRSGKGGFMPLVLAVSGLKNSGKTTSVEVLLECLGEGTAVRVCKTRISTGVRNLGTDSGISSRPDSFRMVGRGRFRVELGNVVTPLTGWHIFASCRRWSSCGDASRFFPVSTWSPEGGMHLTLRASGWGHRDGSRRRKGIIAFYGENFGDAGSGMCEGVLPSGEDATSGAQCYALPGERHPFRDGGEFGFEGRAPLEPMWVLSACPEILCAEFIA
jgi:hypothetical protein